MSIDTSAIEDLVTRVEARLPGGTARLIGFIASAAGEGNSTLARAYASTSAARPQRRVLLLKAGDGKGAGVMQALADDQPLDALVKRLPTGAFVAGLGSDADGALWALVARADLWQALRERFDDIVVDLPSPAESRLGLAIAPHCDGVVVVLEAEKTRVPVVSNLLASLQAVRANVLGTVLNKRRFHLPERVYRWL